MASSATAFSWSDCVKRVTQCSKLPPSDPRLSDPRLQTLAMQLVVFGTAANPDPATMRKLTQDQVCLDVERSVKVSAQEV